MGGTRVEQAERVEAAAEALAWPQQRGQLLLDGEGGPGLGASLVGVNLPFAVIGTAAGSRQARRRRPAG